jgi:hypothetical protein
VTRDRYSGLPAVPPIAAAITTTTATTTAAATAATAATTTTTAAAATGTTAATATATATTLRAFFRFVDAQGASVDHLAVDAFDRALGLLVRAHGDEREAAGLPSGTISHDVDIRHFAVLCESSADSLGIRVK